MAIKIALAGNPNCGKTTMFNALTGANQYVGNMVVLPQWWFPKLRVTVLINAALWIWESQKAVKFLSAR